ncbi:MAG: DUF3048 domain-containing protein [bacterium]|nr:DUF3048 domain-containing protein [bacterium]
MKIRIVIGILVAIIVAFAGYKLYPFFAAPEEEEQGENIPIERENGKKLRFAVVVENYFPDARPQSGLSQADFVFETLAESGITRFLAFYSDTDVAKIGPVRSARPYFVDWVLGQTSVFAYSGTSIQAAAKISALGSNFKGLDEYFNEQFFWRDGTRKAPHNLYTSTDLLRSAVEVKSWQEDGKDLGWVDGPTLHRATSTVEQIEIDFSFPAYFVTYKYDSENNSYHRFIGSKPDIDANTNTQIAPKNIVVLFTTSSVIDQKLLTINLQILGSGKAMIFRSGGVTSARWKKDSADAPLRLLEADDSLIELNHGQTWFAIIDQNGNLAWE